MVSRAELRNVSPHRLHHARAIGHGDSPVGNPTRGRQHAVVMEVQRTRMEPDPDLARPGLAGVGKLNGPQMIESPGAFSLIAFMHASILRSRAT